MSDGFVQHELENQLYAIILMRGFRPDGQQYYAYISIRVCNLDAFAQARRENDYIEPTEYGLVLRHGIGNPDEETKAYMEEEYGFSHESVLDV